MENYHKEEMQSEEGIYGSEIQKEKLRGKAKSQDKDK